MYRQIKKLVVLLLTSTIATTLPQVSIAAPKGFQSPSGNIFCELIPGVPGEISILRCEIMSSLKPKPPQPYPGYCELEWGQGFLLPGRGRPEILCIIDTIADKDKPVLNYGSDWNSSGFKCVSQKIGLTCTNSDGIGFFLSQEKWYVFGLSRPSRP
ncbi:MAG: hypothetical protein RLZZ184_777 [Cyanobacteriota bacterium]|jgi:hypothetical protein